MYDSHLHTFEIRGIDLDVHYTIDVDTDPYGTGDSPISYDVDIHIVEATDSTTNIKDLVSSDVIDMITDEIIALWVSKQ